MIPEGVHPFEAVTKLDAIRQFSDLWRERQTQFDGATLKDDAGKPVWFSDQVRDA